MKRNIIISVIIATVLGICLWNGSKIDFSFGRISDKKLSEYAENNRSEFAADISTLKEVKTIKLDQDYGLSKVVLADSDSGYLIVGINETQKYAEPLKYSYKPLAYILEHFLVDSNKDENIELLKNIALHTNEYNFNFLSDESNAKAYLRNITDSSGLISTADAQEIISDSIRNTDPDISSSDYYEVVFEDTNANPLYYILHTQDLVYNWSHPDEASYEIWKSMVDASTEQTMIAIFGPPYVFQESWIAKDVTDDTTLGSYSSLDALKADLSS